MLAFEWTFRAGDVLTFVGGVGVDASLKAAMARCLDEISAMKTELAEFGKAMTKLAVQETKIDLLMKWYDELRRGKGMINPD